MNTADKTNSILKRIAENKQTEADVQYLRKLLISDDSESLKQLGKYNINIGTGKDIHIGDKVYYQNNDEAIQALIQVIRASQYKNSEVEYFRTIEACTNRQAIEKYFENVLQKLRQRGCLEIRQNVLNAGILFNYIARFKDFEPGFGMRGEAFFMFSEFATLQMTTLQQFSAQSMVWARAGVSPDTAGQALFNFRFPTHFCFAIALVDELDPKTRQAIQTTNPFDLRVDMLWYEIPVVYELNQQQLCFYNKPTSIWEQFKGEIVWKQLREIIQQILSG
ncbi:hypothetical protein G7B40_023740 [Aetokthonos hydrillicola Thurmond2011]|jgi:hypothetical protein|uniref:Effector-associated domain-containing protein n=1 Tax=Aetokthonos hydrillicola Thurmond2011 TaxID=2712845 RepID=A0AAP5IEP5_9CYAN|nr:hypothetical protein [Aetokthonos hydrillicola]MBO3460237.1 hypothetical protein [Aetokthonos hydrillicola CCALA 1050]MBW4586970.1 hypothetical protein [Aetokthonos hydrillicola CCALA 1050]MDR9897555.1 hypothetical protein [Aetokthonos hydrillicola Thurmond2011]